VKHLLHIALREKDRKDFGSDSTKLCRDRPRIGFGALSAIGDDDHEGFAHFLLGVSRI